MTPLMGELLAARRFARQDRELCETLSDCELDLDGLPLVWGFDFVSIDGAHYEPVRGGQPAVIVPAIEDGEIVDLVAMGLKTRACRTRTGQATILGREWLDAARWAGTSPAIFPDPLTWLYARCRGVVLLDLSAARFELADLPSVACSSDLFAIRLNEAMRVPVHIPAIFVPEAHHAAR